MTYGQYVLLGTNLGDKLKNLITAKKAISQISTIVKQSSIYETAAWGVTDQPSFYNQVLEIQTSLTAEELLANLLLIEKKMGRVRYKKWGSRVIDIDILYFGNENINLKNLQIPHPGIQDRRFTLEPLVEIAPNFIHPLHHKSNKELLKNAEDNSSVAKLI